MSSLVHMLIWDKQPRKFDRIASVVNDALGLTIATNRAKLPFNLARVHFLRFKLFKTQTVR